MSNYAKSLGRDVNGNPFQEAPPPYPTLSSSMRENAVASSVLAINPNTTIIEVAAIGGEGIAIRWIPTTETASTSPYGSVIASGLGANYTHIVPAATFRRFIVPKETQGAAMVGQIGSVNGLYQRVAAINVGTTASSVLFAEF